MMKLVIFSLIVGISSAAVIQHGHPSWLKQEDPVECREVLTDRAGSFQSLNYPDDYPNNLICTWEIQVEEGQRIRLSFLDFHMEASVDCSNDYLEIFDGENYSVYCGRDFPPDIESVNNTMSVVAVTDEIINVGNKFSAEYQTIDDGSGEACQYVINVGELDSYGFIMSPNHPSNYPNNLACRWDFVTNSTSTLRNELTGIAFLRTRTQWDEDTQTGDQVTVYLDDSTQEIVAGTGQQVDVGSHESLLPAFYKRSDNVSIVFTSDSSLMEAGFLVAFASDVPREVFGGFPSKADNEKDANHVKAKKPLPAEGNSWSGGTPNATITMDFRTHKITSTNPKYASVAHFGSSPSSKQDEIVDFGFFMSPHHPYSYDAYTNVEYEILVEEGMEVAIEILRFSTEQQYDVLRIQDGDEATSLSFSGNDALSNYVYVSTNSSRVTAKFTSDHSYQFSGFLAAVAAVDLR